MVNVTSDTYLVIAATIVILSATLGISLAASRLVDAIVDLLRGA